MDTKEKGTEVVYRVVVNEEEQYSIWPENRVIPQGWRDVGKVGTKEECLAHIKEVWTDMRPLSLRKSMEDLARRRPELEQEEKRRQEEERKKPPDPRDNLVQFLSEGLHPVEVALRPNKSLALFKEAMDRKYVHIRFTDTRGGTELGFRLDESHCDTQRANLAGGTGNIHIEGDLVLDYVPVRCVADLSLETLTGQGQLIKNADRSKPA